MMPHAIAENAWFVAIDKPAGLITHSDGRTREPALTGWIAERYPGLCGIGGAWVSPQGEHIPLNGLVHRLDRTTSGVIIAAKTNEAYEFLKGQFRERRVKKVYLAWAHGVLDGSGTIIAEIVRASKPGRWIAKECAERNPRAAITRWSSRNVTPRATLLEVVPQTGRTHQIRVHLAHVGHPLLGDHLYAAGQEQVLGFRRPALHASRLGLTLPDGSWQEFTSHLPLDFRDAKLSHL